MLTKSQIREQAQRIQILAENFLIDTCYIQYPESVDVVNGEEVITWTPAVQWPCRLIIRSGSPSSNVSSQERAPAQTIYTGNYRVQLPVIVSDFIDEGDRIIINDRYFTVTFVPPVTDGTGAFIVTVQEIT